MVCEKEVHDFLERDDNSRCMPGEANVKKVREYQKADKNTDGLFGKLAHEVYCRMPHN